MNKINFLFLFLSIKIHAQVEYPKPPLPYYSQDGQDKFLNETIFLEKKSGTFIEIGAHDGITRSNTYFFEKNLNWTGICIEPHPERFKELIQNRRCICLNGCIFNRTGMSNFLQVDGYAEMLSGLTETYDNQHKKRIDSEIKKFGGTKKIIPISCFTFNEMCRKYNISHIDFISIDVEGSEEAIIKSIDLNKIKIDIIVIENNYHDHTIKNFLISHNYQLIKKLGGDEIYQLK